MFIIFIFMFLLLLTNKFTYKLTVMLQCMHICVCACICNTNHQAQLAQAMRHRLTQGCTNGLQSAAQPHCHDFNTYIAAFICQLLGLGHKLHLT